MAALRNVQKVYSLDQSPFFKLKSHRRLADVLGISLRTLKSTLKKGDTNYYTGKVIQKNGKKRDIEVPLAQLYRIHSRVNRLLSRIEKPKYLESGVKGKSHVTNAIAHVGEYQLKKADIQNFYNSTSRERVANMFEKQFKCTHDVASTLSKLVTYNSRVPTGSPLSQSVAFFTNKSIFDQVDDYCKKRNVAFSVYVDDLTFSGKNLPKNLFDSVKMIFENSSSYVLHKYRQYKPSTPKLVTGVIISKNRILVPNGLRLRIKKDLDSIGSILSLQDEELQVKFFQRLVGSLYSAGQISPSFKLKGKEVVSIRRQHNIKSMNQNS